MNYPAHDEESGQTETDDIFDFVQAYHSFQHVVVDMDGRVSKIALPNTYCCIGNESILAGRRMSLPYRYYTAHGSVPSCGVSEKFWELSPELWHLVRDANVSQPPQKDRVMEISNAMQAAEPAAIANCSTHCRTEPLKCPEGLHDPSPSQTVSARLSYFYHQANIELAKTPLQEQIIQWGSSPSLFAASSDIVVVAMSVLPPLHQKQVVRYFDEMKKYTDAIQRAQHHSNTTLWLLRESPHVGFKYEVHLGDP